MVNLVWLIDPTNLFETQWIHELFHRKSIAYEEKIDLDHQRLYPNAVFVINHSIDYELYFKRYHEANMRFGAIHLSDETLRAPIAFYTYDQCMFVFRNYHHPGIHNNKVITFGLGYKTGFDTSNTDTDNYRDLVWSFAGNIHDQNRIDCLQALQHITPHEVHTTMNGFNSSNGLSTKDYQMLMTRSKFVPCPIGQGNIDSFRVYEALEVGAIPIVMASTEAQPYEPSYWYAIFPWRTLDGIPMIIVTDWLQATKRIQCMINNPQEYKQTCAKIRTFWNEAKETWAAVLKIYCEMLDSVMHDDLS